MQGSCPGPSALPQDPPKPRLSIALRCSIWTAPKGQAAPRSTARLSRSRNSFYCQKLAPVKGPYSPAGTGSASTPCTPHPWGAVPGSVLAARAKPPMLLPGALTDLGQHQELKLVLSPFSHGWVRKRMCLTLSLGVSSSAASLLAALGPSEPWPGVGCLPSGHHLVQPQALQLLHQVPAEDAAPGCGSILTPGHRGGMGLRILRVLGVE